MYVRKLLNIIYNTFYCNNVNDVIQHKISNVIWIDVWNIRYYLCKQILLFSKIIINKILTTSIYVTKNTRYEPNLLGYLRLHFNYNNNN